MFNLYIKIVAEKHLWEQEQIILFDVVKPSDEKIIVSYFDLRCSLLEMLRNYIIVDLLWMCRKEII